VVLVDGYGLDYADASRVLDVAPGTVASRLNRARRRLRGFGSSVEDAA
jgi:DNA-directed RNA polymerase specialized sigma24 family protein